MTGGMPWPEWAQQLFAEKRIIPSKLTNMHTVYKAVVGLTIMVKNPAMRETAYNLMLTQPDILKYLKKQETDPSFLAPVFESPKKPTESASEKSMDNSLAKEASVTANTSSDKMTTKLPDGSSPEVLKKLVSLAQLIKANNNKKTDSTDHVNKKVKLENGDAAHAQPQVKEEEISAVQIKQEPMETIKKEPNPPVQTIEIKPPTDDVIARSDPTDVIGYGMIKCGMMSVQHSILYSYLGESSSVDVILAAEPTPTPGLYALRVECTDGRKIGYVEKNICRVLSPLLKALRVDGNIPKPPTMSAAPQIHLTLFGARSLVHQIGKYLSGQKIILTTINALVSVPCINPHAGLQAQKQDYIQMGQVTKSADEVKSQIDAIYNTLVSAEDLPEMEPDQRLITNLYPHQKQALHFMMQCEHPEDHNGGGLWKKHLNGTFENLITGEFIQGKPKFHRGGILADDMGLGKTIEVISLILKTHNESNNWIQHARMQSADDRMMVNEFDPSLVPSKGTLIVCPLSTVSNWEDQIQSHVRRGALSVYVYHGAARCQDPLVLSKFNVVLTTYNVLSLEYGKDLRSFKRHATEAKANAKPPAGALTSILHKMHWYRIVLDEAHIIKDTNTGQSKSVCAMSAEKKWCLTGTPIQNKLEDIYSLVNFLNIEPFCSKIAWTNYITKSMKMKTPSGGNIGVARLQTLMKSVTLRRTKNSKIYGKPILSLPPRHDHIHYLNLDHTEQTLYDRASAQAQKVFQGFEQEGSVLRHYVHLLELILKLRQICTHPLLCKDYERLLNEDDGAIKWNMERALHLLSLLKDSGDEDCCLCGTYVDGIEFNPHISKCGHMYCDSCYKGGFTKGAQFTCNMCQTPLVKSDIIPVIEPDEDSGDKNGVRKVSEPLVGGKMQPQNVMSSKVTALLDDLAKAKQEAAANGEPPVKSIIFSQWTHMLDLMEKPLTRSGHKHVRLDGRMSRAERTASMERFKRDSGVTIMLVSLKAGGVGLNLTSACRVYIMEPYWNPAIEQQAIDRVHRLGQTRPVHTVRFIVQGTIEDSILELQRKKLALAQMTFKEDETTDLSAIDRRKKMKRSDLKKDKEAIQKERMNDLRLLFNLKPATMTVPPPAEASKQ